jgi:hypothetical protein
MNGRDALELARTEHEPVQNTAYRRANASLGEAAKGAVVFIGSLVLDGFGIEHLINGSSSTGIKELVGGLLLGAFSGGFSIYSFREYGRGYQFARELEGEGSDLQE